MKFIRFKLMSISLLVLAIQVISQNCNANESVDSKQQLEDVPNLVGNFFRDNLNRLETTGRGLADHLIQTIQEAPVAAASELLGEPKHEQVARSLQEAAVKTGFVDQNGLVNNPLSGFSEGGLAGLFQGLGFTGFVKNYLAFIKDLALKFNLPHDIIVEKLDLFVAKLFGFCLSKINFIMKLLEKVIKPDDCMLRSVCSYGYNFQYAKSIVEQIDPVTLEDSVFIKAMARGITQSKCEEYFRCADGSAGAKSIATAGLSGREVSKTEIKRPSQSKIKSQYQ